MTLPFTPDQFFAILAVYNGQFLIVAAAWWLASLAVVAAAWRTPSRYSRLLTHVLAALWVWNAVAYHALLFTRINPAAWLFAALFALEAVLLIWASVRHSHDYFTSHEPRARIGLGLIAYSFVYPFLSALTHQYPATPTFAVPCPTAILTIGLLLTMKGEIPTVVAIVPALWALVGGSAAALLDVPTDYVLLASGVLLIAVLVRECLPSPLRSYARQRHVE
jgi:uncharacterized protein DUF6064